MHQLDLIVQRTLAMRIAGLEAENEQLRSALAAVKAALAEKAGEETKPDESKAD